MALVKNGTIIVQYPTVPFFTRGPVYIIIKSRSRKISISQLGKPPAKWISDPPTASAIKSAVAHGKEALTNRTRLESDRKPLERNTPAIKAQRAAATSAHVKPLADAAYAAEQATRALANG